MAQEPSDVTPEEEASSPGSSTPSPTSSSPFVGNVGPGFDPERAPDAAELAGEDGEPAAQGFEVPIIPEEQIRSVLKNGGDLAHAGIGVGQLDWVMTDVDQDRIAPPLTRIVNKHEQLARVMGRSDELSVAVGAGLYTWRSLLEREAVLKAERAGAARAPAPARERAPEPEQAAPMPAQEAPEGVEPESWGGVSVAPGYVPESERRFGRKPTAGGE